ncbi:MAG: hypothetical protein U0V74_08120 [Chitinophagales bacterium]
MKTIKRITLTLFLLITLTILFRSWLFNHLVTYKSIGTRNNYTLTDTALITELEKTLPQSPQINELTDRALRFTATHLTFSGHQQSANPNQLYYTRNAHCVGYASFYAASCNYLFKKYNLTQWQATPHIGQLYLLGVNIHPYFNTPFFKDHDFVLLTNSATNQTLAVDPSLYDYTFIKQITYTP